MILDPNTEPGEPVVRPTFFHSLLTGTGGRTGLVSADLLARVGAGQRHRGTPPVAPNVVHGPDQLTTTIIPTAVIGADVVNMLLTAPVSARPGRALDAALVPGGDGRTAVSLDVPGFAATVTMEPESCQVDVWPADGNRRPAGRSLTVWMRCVFTLAALPAGGEANPGTAMVMWTTDPVTDVPTWVCDLLGNAEIAHRVDVDALADDLRHWPVADQLHHQAEQWSTGALADKVTGLIADLGPVSGNDHLNVIIHLVRRLNLYKVPLEVYRRVAEVLGTVTTADQRKRIEQVNANLALVSVMGTLADHRDELARPPAPIDPATVPDWLTPDQKAAVCSLEPLILVQAAAGTGKTTTLVARLEAMLAAGVPAERIRVMTFTNAAADQITERHKNVPAATIARTVMDMYARAHPTHALSTAQTLVNTIAINYGDQGWEGTFCDLVLRATGNGNHQAMADLNVFVAHHRERVVDLLDAVGQTTLELHLVLCHQQVDDLVDLADGPLFFVIDEVQDTSVWEFIFVLSWAVRSRSSVFMVGDASQTLFEFRFADPQSLNALEASGVFTTFALQTNYRSRQEICDYANVLLGQLDTNRFARLQLQANDLTAPTPDTFAKTVQVEHHTTPVQRFIAEDFADVIAEVADRWVAPRVNQGRRVALIAYSRREVDIMLDVALGRFGKDKTACLVAKRSMELAMFSQWVRRFWHKVENVPAAQAPWLIHHELLSEVDFLVPRAGGSPKVREVAVGQITQWWQTSAPVINGWIDLHHQGVLDHQQVMDLLRDNLLGFEISMNQRRLNVVRASNANHKQKVVDAQVPVVVSTIHGVKGLEFDHTVVVLKTTEGAQKQDFRRLAYVALTRARIDELVVSYGPQEAERSLYRRYHDLVLNALQDTAAVTGAA